MTDKQIIIDGVDVSRCECIIEDYQRANNFEGRYEHIKNVCELGERGAGYYNLFCKDNPSCYYKQLKRKEQECEALQMSENEAREIIAELKAECKELKEKVKELHQGWIDCDKERNLQEANSEFRQRVINRYKQTFTGIKEIAEENIRISESEGLNGVYRRGLAEQILQKINEVLND